MKSLSLTLCDPMGHSPPGSLSMEFFRQEYWSGLPSPPPRDLPCPRIKPTSPVSPAFQANYFTAEIPGKPSGIITSKYKKMEILFL